MPTDSSTLPGPIKVPNLRPQFALSGGLGGAASGAAGGSLAGPIGTVVGAVAGFLGGLFGGGGASAPPTLSQTFVDTLRQYFPDQNAPICGIPFDISFLNGDQPAVMNIPCDDPNFGNINRAGLEWAMKTWGLGALVKDLWGFIQAPQGAPQGGGAATVNVSPTINTAVTIGADALAGVAAAIAGGVSQSVAAANGMTEKVVADVTGQLNTTTGKISDFLGAFTNGIPQFFTSLTSSLMNPFNAITDSLHAAISGVGSLLGAIENDVLKPLGGLIVSSVAGLGGIEQTISSQIGALGGEIGQLVTSLLPGISGGLNGIEKVLERLGTIWTGVKDNIHFDTISADLKHLGDAIAGIAGKQIDTVFRPIDLISETCSIAKFDEDLQARGQDVQDAPKWEQWLAKLGMYVFLQAARMLATVEKIKEQGAESINRECPITKIDVGTVVSLWRRGILNEESAKHEMLVQGYNADRQKALYDGTAFLESPGTALDYWYRHIASDDDLRGLLLSNGFSLAQIEAAKAASQQLGSPQDALRGWLYNLLDESEVDKVLNVNRYDNAQIELLKALSRRPASTAEILAGENTRHVLGSFSLPSILGLGTDWDTVPQWYTDAGKAEGLSDQAIQQRWWAHWQIPDPGTVIQQYFRGLRTETEVGAVMDRYFIPKTLQTDLINVSRPLIPLRSVGSMLVNGVLNKDEARHVLEMHGMDDTSIDKMIHYALLAKPKASTAVAATSHATSISSARTLFEDGAITEQQYREILAEHDLTPSAIDAELQVATIQETVKQRKQAGADIVNEYQAGLIDLPTAKQQLAQLNFTVAEQAKYAKQLRAAKTAVSKVPSEGDLNHFLQNSIITGDEYTAALEAAGYSEQWAKAFLSWRQKPTTTPDTTAPPTPAPTGA